jgi:hypothetical protein
VSSWAEAHGTELEVDNANSMAEAPSSLTNLRMSVPFLLNYTKPGSDILTDVFGIAQYSPLSHSSSPDTDSTESELASTFLDDLTYLVSGSASPSIGEVFYDGEPEIPLVHTPALQDARLKDRLTELVSQLTSVYESLSAQKGTHIRPFEPALRKMLFTVPNLLEFTDLYFQSWPSECQLLHRPTFEVDTVSLPVLLAIFLIGATYSFPRDTASMARECFDLAEEFIFQHEDFTSILQNEGKAMALTKSRVEILQAAALVETVHHGNFNSLSGRRTRVHRISQTIAAARQVRLFCANNDSIPRGNGVLELFNWDSYVKEESKVRYTSPFSC